MTQTGETRRERERMGVLQRIGRKLWWDYCRVNCLGDVKDLRGEFIVFIDFGL